MYNDSCLIYPLTPGLVVLLYVIWIYVGFFLDYVPVMQAIW